jgi:hypothetical protein
LPFAGRRPRGALFLGALFFGKVFVREVLVREVLICEVLICEVLICEVLAGAFLSRESLFPDVFASRVFVECRTFIRLELSTIIDGTRAEPFRFGGPSPCIWDLPCERTCPAP